MLNFSGNKSNSLNPNDSNQSRAVDSLSLIGHIVFSAIGVLAVYSLYLSSVIFTYPLQYQLWHYVFIPALIISNYIFWILKPAGWNYKSFLKKSGSASSSKGFSRIIRTVSFLLLPLTPFLLAVGLMFALQGAAALWITYTAPQPFTKTVTVENASCINATFRSNYDLTIIDSTGKKHSLPFSYSKNCLYQKTVINEGEKVKLTGRKNRFGVVVTSFNKIS